MKKWIFGIVLFVSFTIVAQVPHRYYIGETKVDVSLWNSIPDSVRQQCATENWDYDSIIIEKIHLPIEYKLDSINGNYIIIRRSEDVIAQLKEKMYAAMQSSSKDAYRLHYGDSVPNFKVIKNPGGAPVENVLQKGKCYLINFWATWCGNCLLELLPTEIPQLAEKFVDDKDFVFLPICIDSCLSELESFFHSERGERWEHLKYITTLDQNRKANSIFAEAGHLPLTVVVGKNGRIVYIRIGRISTKDEFDELENSIITGLSSSN